MLASQIPAKVPLPFANAGTKNAIPTASQIGITAGAASLTDGFPPLTFTPLASGGVPPAGADFNGILNMITAVQQWQSAGGIFKYDATFSASIGGYPKGSILMSTSNDTTWLNLVDNNTTNPDATDGSAANWAPLDAYGIAAIAGLTNANVTLTPAQSGKPIITLSGTLTGNVQVIFPVTLQQWRIVNNTTGAFAVTCKTAAGTGGAVTQGASQLFYGDGTNLVPMPADARYATIAAGLKFGGIVPIVNTTTHTIASIGGKFVSVNNAAATTQTFPLASTATPGQAVGFTNLGAGLVTFARQGSDNLFGGLSGTTSFALNTGESFIAVCDGGANWHVLFANGAVGLVPQTLQDMAASRTVGGSFTNGTPREIMVMVGLLATATSTLVATVDGRTMRGNSGGSGQLLSITFPVPPGKLYSVTADAGTPTISTWIEKR